MYALPGPDWLGKINFNGQLVRPARKVSQRSESCAADPVRHRVLLCGQVGCGNLQPLQIEAHRNLLPVGCQCGFVRRAPAVCPKHLVGAVLQPHRHSLRFTGAEHRAGLCIRQLLPPGAAQLSGTYADWRSARQQYPCSAGLARFWKSLRQQHGAGINRTPQARQHRKRIQRAGQHRISFRKHADHIHRHL
ncbi:MAG: hypothetical protein RL334_1254 [Chloroflexota bacterium]